jgi:hypothetical protein
MGCLCSAQAEAVTSLRAGEVGLNLSPDPRPPLMRKEVTLKGKMLSGSSRSKDLS